MSKIFIQSLVILFLTIQAIYSQRESWGYAGDREIFIGVWNGDTIYYANSLSCILNEGYSSNDVNDFIEHYDAAIRFNSFENAKWGSIDFPVYYDALELIKEWQSSGLFYSVEPVRLVKESSGVNDPKYIDGTQWYFDNYGQNPPGGTVGSDINISKAWDITRGSPDILISVIDSGIPLDENTLELSHPDLNNYDRILLEYSLCFISSNCSVRDGRGHGTHVTGIIAAETNNEEGIAGVAGNCKIIVCRVFDDQGNGTDDGIIGAIIRSCDHAENGLRVINMSLVASESKALENAIVYTRLSNIVVVCAAGNHPGSNIQYPAAYSLKYDNVIAVSATDHNDDFASTYSFGGLHINVAAPGGYGPRNTCPDGNDIHSTLPNYYYTLQSVCPNLQFNYDYLWGTSMSAPIVSGIAALILSVNPDLSASQVRDIIQSTADDKGEPGFDWYYGYGRVNAHQAVLLSLAYANKSTNYIATAHNNNHILERGFSSNLHEVFSSGEEIFYRRSSDNGESWDITKRISMGNGSNSHPSIASGNNGSNDVLCLVWQKKIDSRHYDIMYSMSSNMGTSWSTPQIVPGCSNVWISLYQSGDYYGPGPTPVVASFVGDETGPAVAFLLVYAAENGLHYRYNDAFYLGWIIPYHDIVPGSSGSNSTNWYPSLATYNSQDSYGGFSRVNLIYDNRYNSVFSQIFNYLNGSVSWTNRVQVSSMGDNNRLSSIAVDYTGNRLAVWSGFNGNNFAIRFRKGLANGTWGLWQKEWSVSGVNSLCPSVTYYNKGGTYPYGIDILWYTESANPLILNKRYSGREDIWVPDDPYIQVVSLNSSFPNLTHERQNSPLPLQLWTDQSAQPYSLLYNTVFLPKEEILTANEIRRAAEITDTSDNSYLRIELSEPIVKLANGDEFKIFFKSYNYLDTMELTTENIFEYLQTELVNIPNNAQSVTLKININSSQPDTLLDGTLNTAPQTPFRTINFGLVARDDSSRIILNNIGNRLLSNLSGIHHYSHEFTINASILRRRNVQLIPNIYLSEIFNQNNLYFALVNVSIEGDSLGKGLHRSDEMNALPTDFSLGQNYPNPFNPVTQIDYSLVKDGLVTLKIFDLLGKEVTTLINEEKQPGTYTVLFNAGNLSSGIYFYQLKTKNFVSTKKMILLR